MLDHLAAPPIGGAEAEPWSSLLARAAEHPDVYAKVSGLYPAADPMAWSTESVRPFVDHALAVFGPRRLMYGGDWPVSVLAGDYEAVWAGLAPIFAELSDADRDEMLGGTAVRCYGIDPGRLAALPTL